VCPVCGFSTEVVIVLRRHVEIKHTGLLRKIGAGRMNSKIFWRSKQGIRKISSDQVCKILSKYHNLAKQPSECIKFLDAVLRVCLVAVGKDDC